MVTDIRKLRRAGRAGFTLIELLVVIAIIGILAGFLTSAVQNLMKGANARRAANNSALLKAAIMEYRHDFGRWPLDEATLRNITPASNGTIRKTFSGDNNAIVKNLLGVKVPGSSDKKDYLSLQGFTTPVSANVEKWPVTEVVDASLVYKGEALDDNGAKVSKRTNPVLVYYSEFIHCRECDTYYQKTSDRRKCGNCGHKFTRAERRNTVSQSMPYSITIDFFSNTVTVSPN